MLWTQLASEQPLAPEDAATGHRSAAGGPQPVGDAAGVGPAQPHLLAPGPVAAHHLDVGPAQAELGGEQAGEGVVGAAALGGGGDLDLEGVSVPADDPGPGRPGLDVDREHHVAVVVDPERGHAAGYARPGRRPGNLVPMAGNDDAADSDAGEAARDLDDRVAAVYGGPLASFVAERDALARELRSAGRRDEAAQVKKLRKPKLVAWALDAGARADPGALAALVAAVDGLRGPRAGADVRAAIAALRAAEGPVVDAAAEAAGDHDQTVDRATLAAAVRAVVGDPEGLAALRAGRLVDVPAGGGLGVPLAGPGGPAGPAGAARPPVDGAGAGDRASVADRTAEDDRAVSAGTAEAGDRTEAARYKESARKEAARLALAEAERAARAAADEARRADGAAEEAEATARDLQDQAAAAQRRADEAAEAAGRARREAGSREAARDQAEAALAEARVALRAPDD